MSNTEVGFWWWRLLVCLHGLKRDQHWVWDDIREITWRKGYENAEGAEDFYIEWWCHD